MLETIKPEEQEIMDNSIPAELGDLNINWDSQVGDGDGSEAAADRGARHDCSQRSQTP